MKENILEIEGLFKSFYRGQKSFREKHSIINNLSISIKRNSITALLGGNGTGKTTLFNIVSGFLLPDGGSISYIADDPISILNLSPYRREHLGIGRLFQDDHVFSDLTILENLIIANRNSLKGSPGEAIFRKKNILIGEKQLKIEATEIIEMFLGNDHVFLSQLNTKAADLSFGQRRILGLLRLFMSDANLLLLDEPTSGIDPGLVDTFADILKKAVISHNKTIFLIEHNMSFVRKIAQSCLYLDEGKIKLEGPPDIILANTNVQKSYLGI